MNPIQEKLKRAAELDDRRRLQIQNQIDSINRLLEGHTYEEEMEDLHALLVAEQSEVARLEEEVKELRLKIQGGGG
jgi:hypothetical protein